MNLGLLGQMKITRKNDLFLTTLNVPCKLQIAKTGIGIQQRLILPWIWAEKWELPCVEVWKGHEKEGKVRSVLAMKTEESVKLEKAKFVRSIPPAKSSVSVKGDLQVNSSRAHRQISQSVHENCSSAEKPYLNS